MEESFGNAVIDNSNTLLKIFRKFKWQSALGEINRVTWNNYSQLRINENTQPFYCVQTPPFYKLRNKKSLQNILKSHIYNPLIIPSKNSDSFNWPAMECKNTDNTRSKMIWAILASTHIKFVQLNPKNIKCINPHIKNPFNNDLRCVVQDIHKNKKTYDLMTPKCRAHFISETLLNERYLATDSSPLNGSILFEVGQDSPINLIMDKTWQWQDWYTIRIVLNNQDTLRLSIDTITNNINSAINHLHTYYTPWWTAHERILFLGIIMALSRIFQIIPQPQQLNPIYLNNYNNLHALAQKCIKIFSLTHQDKNWNSLNKSIDKKMNYLTNNYLDQALNIPSITEINRTISRHLNTVQKENLQIQYANLNFTIINNNAKKMMNNATLYYKKGNDFLEIICNENGILEKYISLKLCLFEKQICIMIYHLLKEINKPSKICKNDPRIIKL